MEVFSETIAACDVKSITNDLLISLGLVHILADKLRYHAYYNNILLNSLNQLFMKISNRNWRSERPMPMAW
jgi:hypothetical protein